MRRKRCSCCGELRDPDRLFPHEKGLICDYCEDDDRGEPAATVIYGNDDEPRTIGSYHNDTDGDFEVHWRSTDGWRGYYETKSDNYVRVQDDCILSYSEDESDLKKFDDTLRAYCDDHGIRYARVFARTSNVFSCGYDFFVHKEDIAKVDDFMKLGNALADLNRKYRDPDRFAMTALTGKSGDFDAQDKLLLKAAKRLEAGEDPDQILSDVKEEAKRL